MDTDPSLSDEIDRMYRMKYSRYEATYVKFMVSLDTRRDAQARTAFGKLLVQRRLRTES